MKILKGVTKVMILVAWENTVVYRVTTTTWIHCYMSFTDVHVSQTVTVLLKEICSDYSVHIQYV